jgi:hypothetical protein
MKQIPLNAAERNVLRFIHDPKHNGKVATDAVNSLISKGLITRSDHGRLGQWLDLTEQGRKWKDGDHFVEVDPTERVMSLPPKKFFLFCVQELHLSPQLSVK